MEQEPDGRSPCSLSRAGQRRHGDAQWGCVHVQAEGARAVGSVERLGLIEAAGLEPAAQQPRHRRGSRIPSLGTGEGGEAEQQPQRSHRHQAEPTRSTAMPMWLPLRCDAEPVARTPPTCARCYPVHRIPDAQPGDSWHHPGCRAQTGPSGDGLRGSRQGRARQERQQHGTHHDGWIQQRPCSGDHRQPGDQGE